MVLTSLLGTVIVSVFIQTKRSIGHAIGTVELVQDTRIAVDRSAQVISSAVAKEGQSSIMYPALDQSAPSGGSGGLNERGTAIVPANPETWPRAIIFRTSEDFLNPAYSPNEIMELINLTGLTHAQLMETYKSDAQSSFDYILWWEDGDLNKDPRENVLLCARATPNVIGGVVTYRPDSWADLTDPTADPWADIDPTIPVRAIANHVDSVSFLYTMQNGVTISVADSARVRNAVGQYEVKQSRTEALIQLPTLTME